MWLKHMGQPVIAIAKPSTLIGRHTDCDVKLTLPDISRRHARIDRTPEGYTVTDLGSLNGVIVNGETITGPTPLAHDDTLQIGGIRFDVDLTLAVEAEAA
jgi:pSer/pThr/pTyr-binding forkhead associated (FHA) protein